jgi:hypothetical protein
MSGALGILWEENWHTRSLTNEGIPFTSRALLLPNIGGKTFVVWANSHQLVLPVQFNARVSIVDLGLQAMPKT